MRLCKLKSGANLVFTVEGDEWEVNRTPFAEESLQKVALLA